MGRKNPARRSIEANAKGARGSSGRLVTEPRKVHKQTYSNFAVRRGLNSRARLLKQFRSGDAMQVEGLAPWRTHDWKVRTIESISPGGDSRFAFTSRSCARIFNHSTINSPTWAVDSG